MCVPILEKNDPLIISDRRFNSRLMLGTGKYKNFQEAKDAILLSGCEILTVAIRRAQSSNVDGIDKLLNNLDWTKIKLTIIGYTIGLAERAQRARSARDERSE